MMIVGQVSTLETFCMETVFSPDKSVHEFHGIFLVDTTTFFVADSCHHGLLYGLGGTLWLDLAVGQEQG